MRPVSGICLWVIVLILSWTGRAVAQDSPVYGAAAADFVLTLTISQDIADFSVDNLDDLPAISARIGEELRSQYLLGYSPANPERDGKYRQIRVVLASPAPAPKLEVRYRRGYYAPVR